MEPLRGRRDEWPDLKWYEPRSPEGGQPQDSVKRMSEDEEAELRHRIRLAQINFDLARGHAVSHSTPTPPPAEEEAPPERIERGHSTAGQIQDAHLDLEANPVGGPKTTAELYPDDTPSYILYRPPLWR